MASLSTSSAMMTRGRWVLKTASRIGRRFWMLEIFFS